MEDNNNAGLAQALIDDRPTESASPSLSRYKTSILLLSCVTLIDAIECASSSRPRLAASFTAIMLARRFGHPAFAAASIPCSPPRGAPCSRAVSVTPPRRRAPLLASSRATTQTA
jgi:hypothetical protein